MAHSIFSPGVVLNGIRVILGFIDWGVYTLIVNIYKVFFYVSTSTIIGGDVVKQFFQRIQLILGIFMIFKLAISLLNLIVNPDLIKDKNAGTGKVIMRIVVCLMMLTLVVPLNIPGADEKTKQGYISYNGYINDNGILFGTLYAIQDRVLREQVLAKLIIGYPAANADSEGTPDVAVGDLAEAGNMLATSILKSFVLINVEDDTLDPENICNGDPECPNVYCLNEVQSSGYTDPNATVDTITNAVSLQCGGVLNFGATYAFTYIPIISTVVGVIIAIILLGFTIDVSIRALKLAFLRLLAPIPIISYVDPKASKDSAFASWVKTLSSTYLDLFVRLAIIYFVIFIIQSLAQDGLYIAEGATGMVRVFTYVFIVIGILFFAKQAPNFIKTLLGSKGVGFGPGLSGAVGFLGGVVAGGGLAGAASAALTTANATNEAQAQGKQGPGAWSTGRDLVTKMRTGDDKATGGILNRAQRRLTQNAKRSVGERQLQRLGITYDEADRAKTNMYHAQDLASDAAAIRSRFGTTPGGIYGMSASDQAAINAFAQEHIHDDPASNSYRIANDFLSGVGNDDEILDLMVNTRQTEFQKQKKVYEDADALMKKYGMATTPEDKYSANTRRKYVARTINNAIPRTARREARRDHTGSQAGGTWNRDYRNQGSGDTVNKATMRDIFRH